MFWRKYDYRRCQTRLMTAQHRIAQFAAARTALSAVRLYRQVQGEVLFMIAELAICERFELRARTLVATLHCIYKMPSIDLSAK